MRFFGQVMKKFPKQERFVRENFSSINDHRDKFFHFSNKFFLGRRLALLLGLAFPVLYAQENHHAVGMEAALAGSHHLLLDSPHVPAAEVSNYVPPAECKNLGLIADVDDLLYQMHSNLNSHCLFEIPVEELEKIWGIPVLRGYDLTRSEEEREQDRLKAIRVAEKDPSTIYVQVSSNTDDKNNERIIYFQVNRNQLYRNEYGYFKGSIGEKKFPYYLPPPYLEVIEEYCDYYYKYLSSHITVGKPCVVPVENIAYNLFSIYYWLNPDHDPEKPLLFITTFDEAKPRFIKLYKKSKHLDYIDHVRELLYPEEKRK